MPKPGTGGGPASAPGDGGGTSVAGRTQPVWPWTAAEPAAAAADAVCVQTVCADAWVPKALMATKGLTDWAGAEVAAAAIVGLTHSARAMAAPTKGFKRARCITYSYGWPGLYRRYRALLRATPE